MKRTPPSLTAGYRLRVSCFPDERAQKLKTRIILETTQSFASFVYELSTEMRRNGNNIHLRVLGLKPPQLSLSAAGPARFQHDYEDLTGRCDITIENIDGKTNTFKIRISGTKIALLHSPRQRFTELVV